MKLNVLFAAVMTLGCALSAQATPSAQLTFTFVTDAAADSTAATSTGSGGVSVTAGDTFSVSTDASQLWYGTTPDDSAYASFTSNADGTGYNWAVLNGVNGAYRPNIGTLVGEIDGIYETIGTGTTFTAWATGNLYFAYSDVDTNNSGSITSYVTTAVPEPTNVALLLAGLGMMGLVARRRSQK